MQKIRYHWNQTLNRPFYSWKYINLSYQLKNQKKFRKIGLLWDGFNIYSLKDPNDGELIDKKYFEGLIDDFEFVLSSGESVLFNARYMEMEELLNLRPVVKPVKLLKGSKESIIELKKIHNNEIGEKITEDQILLKDMVTLQQIKNVPKEEEDKYTITLSKLLNNSLAPFKLHISSIK